MVGGLEHLYHAGWVVYAVLRFLRYPGLLAGLGLVLALGWFLRGRRRRWW